MGQVISEGVSSALSVTDEGRQLEENKVAEQPDVKSYRLIQGVFSPEEARQVLMTLIHDKISFHQRNDWSRRERLGETDPPGRRRIDELMATREALNLLLADVEAQGSDLVINCNIDVTLAPGTDGSD